MRFINSRLMFAAPLAILLGATVLSAPARADYVKVGEGFGTDGSVSTYYYDDDTGSTMVITWAADGTLKEVWCDNPNPDDTTTGKGSHTDKPDVAGMIKSGKATYTVRIAPADSVDLMNHSLGNGAGLGPHYNPGDQDNDKGPGNAPVHSNVVKKTAAELRVAVRAMNEVAKALEILGTAMGTGEEGGSESATGPNKNGNGNNHNGVDDSGSYTEGQDKSVGKTEKDLLGAHPEVINPPHLNKTGKARTSTNASNAKSNGLSVTGPGLLGGGAGFSQNGPSATGTPIGTGGGARTFNGVAR